MFHEYREEVTALKQEDAHFAKIFEEHNELDQKLEEIAQGAQIAQPDEIKEMKSRKLALKDEAYAMIMEYRKNHK